MEKESKHLLATLSMKCNGDWHKTFAALQNKEHLDQEEIEECKRKLENVGVLTILDKEYPEYLKQIALPPLVLYYKGDISLLSKNDLNVAFYGKRQMDEDSTTVVQAIEKITEECKGSELVFVTGGAIGTITRLIKVSLERDIKNIVVLAGSLDKPYPSENGKLFDEVVEKGGLVISEYPPETVVEQSHFPARTRIMAGITTKTVILSATKTSGAMVGAMYALQNNHDVYCVPSRLFDEEDGCNRLISEGAIPLVLADQLTN